MHVPRHDRLRQPDAAANREVNAGSSVPAGPPSCAGRTTAANRRRASTSPTSQPAAFSPKVVGRASWSSVRAIIGVERCVSASPAHAAHTPSRSARINSTRARGDQHRRGVEDVLAGRRAVRVRLALAQRPRERHDRARVRPALLAERLDVVLGRVEDVLVRARARARRRASPAATLGRRPPRGAAPARTAPRRWSMREEDCPALHPDVEP